MLYNLKWTLRELACSCGGWDVLIARTWLVLFFGTLALVALGLIGVLIYSYWPTSLWVTSAVLSIAMTLWAFCHID